LGIERELFSAERTADEDPSFAPLHVAPLVDERIFAATS